MVTGCKALLLVKLPTASLAQLVLQACHAGNKLAKWGGISWVTVPSKLYFTPYWSTINTTEIIKL